MNWSDGSSPALENTAPVMRDDEKPAEHSEGQRWHSKKIHCGDGFPMIAQKGRPWPGRHRTPRRSPHPAQHGSLGKIEAKHFQFAVDARCAPCGVFRCHAKDQLAQFLADAFSARPNPTAREPRPIQLGPCTVPANNSLWLDEDQRVPPIPARPAARSPRTACRRWTPGGEHAAASNRQVAGGEPSSQAASRGESERRE
jgi:hypothetical protein